mmetsp:Transcript_59440/g.184235  ORF Transcript_59440/g.184235 Transcript_59440/m.184235 type:complete len:242 (+) Transcript_59440:1018-1743(+)
MQQSTALVGTEALRPAPAEYGLDTYIASRTEIQRIVDLKVQKFQASLNALKRYTHELEEELEKKEEELDISQARLVEEQRMRLAAEAERDSLVHKRSALEAQVVQAGEAESAAKREVDEMDRQAEEVAARLARGELTEEEALQTEEELIRAQARRIAAQEALQQDAQELEQVSAAAEEAEQRVSAVEADEARLRDELEAMRAEMEQVRAERDEEAARREEADSRFHQLVQRIQSKVAGSRP